MVKEIEKDLEELQKDRKKVKRKPYRDGDSEIERRKRESYREIKESDREMERLSIRQMD